MIFFYHINFYHIFKNLKILIIFQIIIFFQTVKFLSYFFIIFKYDKNRFLSYFSVFIIFSKSKDHRYLWNGCSVAECAAGGLGGGGWFEDFGDQRTMLSKNVIKISKNVIKKCYQNMLSKTTGIKVKSHTYRI